MGFMPNTNTTPRSLTMRSEDGALIRCTFAEIDGVPYFRAFVDGDLVETSEGGQARRDWRQARVLKRF